MDVGNKYVLSYFSLPFILPTKNDIYNIKQTIEDAGSVCMYIANIYNNKNNII